MDLMRVRKRIECGTISNCAELRRDLLLIFQNAMMYNSQRTDIYRMAFEMERDVNQQGTKLTLNMLIRSNNPYNHPICE